MKYKIDHDLHIHSYLSICSQVAEQNKNTIFNYAKINKLHTVCITDHYWDSSIAGASEFYVPQNFEHLSLIKPLPKDNDTILLFGCETDIDKHYSLGIPKERFNDFDFIIIPTTHLHMTNWTINEIDKQNNLSIAEIYIKRLDAVLNEDLPFKKIGLAHLACNLINTKSRKDYLETLNLISTNDLEYLFSKASKLGCGVEINQRDMCFTEEEKDTVLRIFRIAKNCGCKFYLGSDAHSPDAFTHSMELFEKAINLLGLTEKDKFHLDNN